MYDELLAYHVRITEAIYEALRGVYTELDAVIDPTHALALNAAVAQSGYYATVAQQLSQRHYTMQEMWDAYTELQSAQRESLVVLSAEQLAELRSAPRALDIEVQYAPA